MTCESISYRLLRLTLMLSVGMTLVSKRQFRMNRQRPPA